MPRATRTVNRLRYAGPVSRAPSLASTRVHSTARISLPHPPSSFIGRTREVRELQRLLSRTRLLTLTGAGGAGKTRLALEVAHRLTARFPGGVTFIAFDSIADPWLVPQTVATAIGVVEKRVKPLLQALREFLRDRKALLVLDNCEHLVAACAELVTTLLEACPDLRVLATSREALGVAGEYIYTVGPLSLPANSGHLSSARLQRCEAVALFAARAHAVNASFVLDDHNTAVVADICRRLDGIPLAIELAAARINALSVEQIAARLQDRFHLLTTGRRSAPPRHQTLHAALDWSYELLSEPERRLFERLSVFAGGLTLEAAERVGEPSSETAGAAQRAAYSQPVPDSGTLDLLSRLVDKSLLAVHPEQDGPRFRMLETVRQYALEKLTERGRVVQARDAHLEYIRAYAERAETHLQSTEQVLWFNRLERELDNVRAALDWALTSGGETRERTQAGLAIAAGLLSFWDSRGYPYEGIERLNRLLAQAERVSLADRTYARALHALGALEWGRGQHARAQLHLERALALGHQLGDQWITADALRNLGSVLIAQGEFEPGMSLLVQSVALWRRTGEDGFFGLGWSLTALGGASLLAGDYVQAQTALQEAEQLFVRVDNKNYLAYVQRRLAQLALHLNDVERAHELCKISLRLNLEVSSQRGVAAVMAVLSAVALARGQARNAAAFLGAAHALLEQMGERLTPVDEAEFNATTEKTRAQLGPASFEASFAQGSKRSQDRIISEALAFGEREQNESPRTAPRRDKDAFGGLTARERQVAALIAQGSTNREIAAALVVGIKTVEAHISHIMNKLDFTSRAQIAAWAVNKGLSPPSEPNV